MERTNTAPFNQIRTGSPAGRCSETNPLNHSDPIPRSHQPTEQAGGSNQSWLDDPDVQEILASIKANPPRREAVTDWSISGRGQSTSTYYTGKRVDLLEEYYREFLSAALKASDEAGDRSIYIRACDQPDVEQAIARVFWS